MVDGEGQGAPVGTELRVTPHSPGLRGRVRQGVASVGSAEHAADLGLGIICGTVLHDLAEGESFPDYQARVIGAYRARWASVQGGEAPPVAVAASVLPGTSPALLEAYRAYDHQRRTEGMGGGLASGGSADAGGHGRPSRRHADQSRASRHARRGRDCGPR